LVCCQKAKAAAKLAHSIFQKRAQRGESAEIYRLKVLWGPNQGRRNSVGGWWSESAADCGDQTTKITIKQRDRSRAYDCRKCCVCFYLL